MAWSSIGMLFTPPVRSFGVCPAKKDFDAKIELAFLAYVSHFELFSWRVPNFLLNDSDALRQYILVIIHWRQTFCRGQVFHRIDVGFIIVKVLRHSDPSASWRQDSSVPDLTAPSATTLQRELKTILVHIEVPQRKNNN